MSCASFVVILLDGGSSQRNVEGMSSMLLPAAHYATVGSLKARAGTFAPACSHKAMRSIDKNAVIVPQRHQGTVSHEYLEEG